MGATADYWSEDAGPRWAAQAAQVDAQLGPIGAVAMECAGVLAGQSAIDVGCGCGGSTLALAARVGTGGHVRGVDVSAVQLEQAQRRAAAMKIDHVVFTLADAETHAFEPRAAQHVFSRFGVMFFDDPDAAFANLRRALAPGGRLTFVCWAAMERNPWMFLPRQAAARHVELPAPGGEDEPGPFSLARRERVGGLLDRAGFADVDVAPLEGELLLGGAADLDAAVAFALEIGPAAAASKQEPSMRPGIAASVREVLEPYLTPEGVRMRYRAWLVSGRCR